MLTILLGPDDFSKKEYVNGLANKEKAELVVFGADDAFPGISILSEQDLFGKKRLFVFYGGFEKLDEKDLGEVMSSAGHAILIQDKLDKRGSFAKTVLGNKKVEVKELALPHGKELDRWIEQRVKILGGAILPEALEELAVRVGRDESIETKFGGKVVDTKEIYTLWQVDGEISKLLALADGEPITKEYVTELVPENREVDVLSIVNAMGEGKMNESVGLIQQFLKDGTGSDEKSLIIQLNALLSEQFRNILMVKDFMSRGMPEGEILSQTSWKSGRLFVIKKIAAKFSESKVRDFLNKLSHLDGELKTSSTPPRVLLDLIVSQLF